MKKQIVEFVKNNKKVIIRRGLLIAGAAATIVVGVKVAEAMKGSSEVDLPEEMFETEAEEQSEENSEE